MKWPGGKRWLAPLIKELWLKSNATRLVEPFCGGLSISLTLKPNRAFLNDYNPHLMNLFFWIKSGYSHEIEMANDKQLFYSHRNDFNQLIRNNEAGTCLAANYFYYLNRTGYNGLCRFNLSGEYNVPFGSYDRINYRQHFSEYQQLMCKWHLSCDDFSNLEIQSGDFVYVDPPYDETFTQYHIPAFDWPDQIRLTEWLAQHDCPMILSNQATHRIIDLYQDAGFELFYLKGPRSISCKTDRQPNQEVLAIRGFDFNVKNYLSQNSLFQRLAWQR